MPMDSPGVDEFAVHLARTSGVPAEVGGRDDTPGPDRTLRSLWESCELSAGDFADEVAGFYQLRRISLPELLAARPLVGQFSRRFLREMTIFPYESANGSPVLATADPTDV